MVLLLDNDAQASATSIALAIAAMESGIREYARGGAIRRPRIDNWLPTSQADRLFNFSSMEGGATELGYYALRIKPDIYHFPTVDGRRRRENYAVRPGLYGGLVLLFSTHNAELLAIFNDGYIQHLRVAATVALGIRWLSLPESASLGILGSGGMARAIPLAAAHERRIRRLRAWSPNRENLERYRDEMADLGDWDVDAVGDPAAAIDGADIVLTCTTSSQPVLDANWIRPGMHINNVSLNELDSEACQRIDTVGVFVRHGEMSVGGLRDDGFGIRLNAMSYATVAVDDLGIIPGVAPNPDRFPNATVVDCVDWTTGQPYQRSPNEVTILANASKGTLEGDAVGSSGMQGIQFAAVGGAIYEQALARGIGRELPTELFLQDIPT